MRRSWSSLVASVALVLLVAQTASAGHSNYPNVHDDNCVSRNYGTFSISGPASGAHVHFTSAAYGQCHWWYQAVCATCDIVHATHWYLPVSYDYDGYYRVEMWIANDDHCTTQNARYRRFAYGTGSGVTENYPINQLGNRGKMKCINCDGSSTSDYFCGHCGGYMQLVDRSNDGQSRVCSDYMLYQAVH